MSSGTILLYEINPELNAELPSQELSTKSDSNHGLPEDITKAALYMVQPQRNSYSSYTILKPINIPRVLWLNKTLSLYQIHLEVFRFFRHSFSAMYGHQSIRVPFRK